ncbi:acylphosphatase [Lysinibacillus sp. BW-2-10]|uniref:acylphosphatase n=1 Tax=Lysinibacillus sp. BW-2-10 TaxID=2590030 RepID=UPI00117F8B8C|nr:acylphosphatase [Lysinibacillus sp. BW-2-10]TSI07915.1 acylphosphatase [Lysinibacillus sp. BW-2-10]
MKALKKLRDGYIIWHANSFKIPTFPASTQIRKRIIFSGKVQKVGFRLEVFHLAERLNLTGWVKNLEDGSVEGEFQGDASKIEFLVACMKSLKRASVRNVTALELQISEGEKDFSVIK